MNGKRVKGAKKAKLKITAKYLGKRIKVRVIGKKPGFLKKAKTSTTTKKVR